MATQYFRNTSDVGQDKGSSRMAIIEHKSDYTLSGDLMFLPVIEDSDMQSAVSTLSKEDEETATYSVDGAKTLTKNFTIMQKDADSLNLPRTLAGKTFAWVKEMSRVAGSNGKYVYEIGVGAKISENFTVAGKSGSTQLTLNVTKNDIDVAFPLVSFADSLWAACFTGASAVTISADNGFYYTEL